MGTWEVIALDLPRAPRPDEPHGGVYRAVSGALARARSPRRQFASLLEVLHRELGVRASLLVERRGLGRLGRALGTAPVGVLLGAPASLVAQAGDGGVVEVRAGRERTLLLGLTETAGIAGPLEGVQPPALAALEHVAPALRMAAEELRLEEERQRAERLARALRLGTRVAEQPPERRWALLARLARGVVRADTAVVRELVGHRLLARALGGAEELGVRAAIDATFGAAGWALAARRAVLMGSAEARLIDPPDVLGSVRGATAADSGIVVPLGSLGGEVSGVLTVLAEEPLRFDDEDRGALEVLARLVALWDLVDAARFGAGTLAAEERRVVLESLGMGIELLGEGRRWLLGDVGAEGRPVVVDLGLRVRLEVRAGERLREAALAALRESADRDPLTGVWNRQAFLARAAARLEVAVGPGLVLLVDLDRLSDINERDGFAAGDRCLVAAVERLLGAVGSEAVVGRIGGDEFAALVPAGAGSNAAELRATVVAALADADIPVSIGVALVDVGGDVLAALGRAEQDLAENQQRRRVARTERIGEVLAPGDMALAPELLRALEGDPRAGQVAAHLQPIVELGTGRIIGAEALARWEHPRHGTILPAHFLPLAVHLRLVERVDEAVRRVALAHLGELTRAGLAHGLYLSFNLSAQSARQRGAAARLLELLERTGIEPGRVVVELTETEIAASALAQLRRTLETLAERGVLIALDDFGVGTSSFRHLAVLPVSIVKVDRAFVAQVTTEEGARLVGAVVELARRLDVELVAEGVQDAESAARLLGLGVTRAQGYYFHRPLSPGGFARLVRQRSRPRHR